MEELLKKAEIFATEKHKGQVDRAGVPYIEHPRFVVARLDGEKEKIVGWLHDTVEDTGATVEEIRENFGDEIAEAVKVLTHDLKEPYLKYVSRIKGNELARKVKIADLTHNMDLSRIPNVSDVDLKRVEKYKKALELLK